MSDHGWSPNDKAVAKAAVERARRRAHEETLALYFRYKVSNIEELWALEQQIRQWRKERARVFYLHYETANQKFAAWLSCGWLQLSDLARLSPERLAAIKAKVD